MIKKFRLLIKCFGLVGAIALTLGVVSFKNVNAKTVTDTGTILSVQDVMSNYNNANLDTVRLFSHSDNGIMNNFDTFNTYYNFNYLPLFDYLSTTHDNLTGSDYYFSDIGFNYNTVDIAYNLDDYCSISWSPLVNTDYLFVIITYDTNSVQNYGFTLYFDCSDTNYNSSTYYNLNTTNDTLLVIKPTIKDYTYSTDYKDYSCSCYLSFDESASTVNAFSGNTLNGIYQYYADYTRDTDNAFTMGVDYGRNTTIANEYQGKTYDDIYQNGYNVGLIDGRDRTILDDYQNKTYNDIYQNGYNNGESDTITNDYQNKTYNQILQLGKDIGYQVGQQSVTNTSAVANSLFLGYVQAGFNILNGLFTPTLLGVPILSILLTFLALILVIWLIKKLL